MRLARFFLIMIVLTSLSLAYTYLQVQIFDLAYAGKSKELRIQKLADDNGDVFYDICTLKSSNHLGVKLLADNSKMKFLDNDHIVQLAAPFALMIALFGFQRLKMTRRQIFWLAFLP